VHLVSAEAAGRLVGVGGVQAHGTQAELKRFYVVPDARGSCLAVALLQALVEYARGYGVRVVRWRPATWFAEIARFGRHVDSATSVCMQQELPAARSC
jgi:putative acetyltransferase